MGRQDSPESPLSSMADSDAFEDSVMEDHDHDHENENENEPEGGHGSPLLPPAKRQKIISNIDSTASSAIIPRDDHEDHPMSDISSDTSGSVPSSPQCYPTGRLDVEDDIMEQVTVCLWDGCDAGDLGNMDELVKHLHNVHIQDLQQTGTYTCEWVGCNRKGKKHASGYALKAHMRSHTREKPFYCYLPECDRSFTRSDALAKHMRTVHETEALRPSDPVPKSMQPGGGQPGPNYATIPPLGTPSPATTNGTNKRLKIVLKTPSLHAGGAGGTPDDAILSSDGGGHENADGTATDDADYLTPLTIDLGFTERELDMPLEKLHRVCRWQLKWATEEGEELRREADELEQLYWREWRQKEALMTQVVRSEVDYNERRKQVERGEADIVAAATASGGALANGDVQPPAPAPAPAPLTLGPLRQPAVRQTGGLMHPQEAATRAQEL